MKGHLSSKKISKYIAGCSSPLEERHVRECRQCAAEIDRIKALFTEFRDSAAAWSSGYRSLEESEPLRPTERLHRLAAAILTWKWAATALVLALILFIPKSLNDRRREMEQLKADVQLWEEVDAQISQRVPEPLAPLMQLVAWEPEAAE
jgi:hypothetical protein